MGKVKLGKFLIDAAEIERQHAEAVSRGRIFGAIEPQAKSVSYDRKQDRLVIETRARGSVHVHVHVLGRSLTSTGRKARVGWRRRAGLRYKNGRPSLDSGRAFDDDGLRTLTAGIGAPSALTGRTT